MKTAREVLNELVSSGKENRSVMIFNEKEQWYMRDCRFELRGTPRSFLFDNRSYLDKPITKFEYDKEECCFKITMPECY